MGHLGSDEQFSQGYCEEGKMREDAAEEFPVASQLDLALVFLIEKKLLFYQAFYRAA
jgi:hypothetical protein